MMQFINQGELQEHIMYTLRNWITRHAVNLTKKTTHFTLTIGLTFAYPYRDYAKVYPGWKNPSINEELPLRQYILATYNNEMAKKYNVKPLTHIPSSYSSRTLSSMKKQLKKEIAEHLICGIIEFSKFQIGFHNQ
jgi:hypothetical protein